MGLRPSGLWASAVLVASLVVLGGCNKPRDNRVVRVDVIGQADQLADPLRHSGSAAAQIILGATAQGLLAFNAKGDVVSALAESWIVEDGGQSYIFRLKRLNWPDGKPVRADQVASLLRDRMRANPQLLAGLTPDVRAMTDRVIEVRLASSLPAFLQLLAQPELAIAARSGGTGPYQVQPSDQSETISLLPVPTADRTELEEDEDEAAPIEWREVQAHRAALALVRFKGDHTDLVLGGRFQHIPLVAAVGLNPMEIQMDPVEGLFGIAIIGSSEFLDEVPVRDALARVIDREAIAQALALPAWRTAAYPLPVSYELGRLPSAPAWSGRSKEDRIDSARRIIAHWSSDHGEPPVLRLALPAGPGASILFRRIAMDFGQIGLRLDRVAMDEPADLRLVDEVAPFDSAFWYIARLDCAAGLRCDPGVAIRLKDARAAADSAEQSRLLAEAEEAIVAFAAFIPLGQSIRWSVVGQRLSSFEPSPRGLHPLNALVPLPN